MIGKYYEECNALLDELYNITKEEYRTTSLFQLAVDSLNLFDMGGNYLEKLQELKEVYLTRNKIRSSSIYGYIICLTC